MTKQITLIGLFLILLMLLTGCSTLLGSAGAASSTPTIVRLTAVTETTSTPAPSSTASSLPTPSLTPAPATPSPVSVSATATVTTAVPSATPTPANVSAVATTKPATTDSLSGDWDFSFGTMSLTQREMSLEGVYHWYGGVDSGQIKGVIVPELNQFQGVWISDRNPNSQKLMRWQLAADYNSFSGATEGTTSQQWCGVRSGQPLPAGCGFSGVWQFRFGSPAGVTGQATLAQSGQMVQGGTYVDSQGHSGEIVDGVVTASSSTEVKLTGLWRNDQGQQDTFEWRLDLTTGRTFQGRRDLGNSEWCGWRVGTSEPEQCGW